MTTIQSIVPLFRHSANGVTVSSCASYIWPGSAASANIQEIASHRLNSSCLVEALWQVAWNPNTGSSLATGVRLLEFYSGVSSDLVTWPEITMANYTGPRTDGYYCLSQMKALLDYGKSMSAPRQIGTQMRGNGSVAPILYNSNISLVWEF